jgi:hypothetical protein
MRVDFNVSATQPKFQAVNQKYLKMAEENYRVVKNGATTEWLESITDDVILFGDMKKQDAIDTMNAARKYVSKASLKVFEDTLKSIKNA